MLARHPSVIGEPRVPVKDLVSKSKRTNSIVVFPYCFTRQASEFEVSLVYILNASPARAT